MSLEEVYKYIDAHVDSFVEDLVRLVKQPSVSAKGEGIEECAILVEKMMQEIGFSTRIIRGERGHPVVYGEIKSKNLIRLFYFTTITMYSHRNLLKNGCANRLAAK